MQLGLKFRRGIAASVLGEGELRKVMKTSLLSSPNKEGGVTQPYHPGRWGFMGCNGKTFGGDVVLGAYVGFCPEWIAVIIVVSLKWPDAFRAQ